MTEFAILLLGGLLAGSLGGLLGIGGGIIVMPLLRFCVGLPPDQAAGTCILAVFFTTLGGSYRHYRQGNVHLRSVVPVIVAGVLATIVFSLLFPFLAHRAHLLDLGIGLVFLVVSGRMLIEGLFGAAGEPEPAGDCQLPGGVVPKVVIGTAAGALPGFLGIGTGGILVPAFTFLLRAPIKIAAAASLTCFCCSAIISAGFKLAQGYTVVDVAIPICIGTLIGANLGAMLNRHVRSGFVKLLFGIAFSYVALKFILLAMLDVRI